MSNVINTVETPISRQYVGARYVPIFDGAWDNTKDYAPLTIVSYQGNSYTSRTYVPSGTAINNETYWALTGNYNAQIEAYRNEVAELSSNIGDVNSLTTASHEVVESINEINSNVNSILDTDIYYPELKHTTFKGIAQDVVIFNNKMFGVRNDGVLNVRDIITDSLITSVNLDGSDKPHGNSICFGNKLHANDTYPLLYVCGYNGVDENNDPLPHGVCYVYHLNDDYSNELIQKITIGFAAQDTLWPVTTRDGAITYGNFMVDSDNNILYVLTTTNSSTRIFKFNLPSLSNSEVTLNSQDIIEYFDVPFYAVPQGCKYFNNQLYLSAGHQVYGNYLSVIDLKNKCQLTCIPIDTTEIEAICFNNDKLYVGGYTGDYMLEVPDLTIYGNIGNLMSMGTLDNSNVCSAIHELLLSMYKHVAVYTASDIGTKISVSSGTFSHLTIQLQYNNYTCDVTGDIRCSDLEAGVMPTITITDNGLKEVPTFTYYIPPVARRSSVDNSVTIGDGGVINHVYNTNTIQISFFNHLAARPAGYMECQF